MAKAEMVLNVKVLKRPDIMGKPVALYDDDWSRIPERVRLCFSDGTTAVYELHQDMPAPIIRENIEIIRKWKEGYPVKRRRRSK